MRESTAPTSGTEDTHAAATTNGADSNATERIDKLSALLSRGGQGEGQCTVEEGSNSGTVGHKADGADNAIKRKALDSLLMELTCAVCREPLEESP